MRPVPAGGGRSGARAAGARCGYRPFVLEPKVLATPAACAAPPARPAAALPPARSGAPGAAVPRAVPPLPESGQQAPQPLVKLD